MENAISYLYGFTISKKISYKDKTVYYTDKGIFLFAKVEDAQKIYQLHNFIKNMNNTFKHIYTFYYNIYGDIISKINDHIFTLIKLDNDYSKKIDFIEMIEFYNWSFDNIPNTYKQKYTNNWVGLWEDKINYLLTHFNNNILNNKNYILIFNYYVSLAESSLEYLMKLNKNNLNNYKVVLSHRRIINSNIKLDFYNPLNLMIDIEQRDIGEYIKSLYYEDEDYINELHYYFKTHKLDSYNAAMLYARIIYPSIFFDDYESSNININKYINFKKYESFIKKIYEVISSYIKISNIDWLK